MKKSLLLVVSVLAVAGEMYAGALTERIAAKYKVKSTDIWYGGQRTVFDFEGYDAWVVEPPVGVAPLAGTPWTWTMQWRAAYVPRTSVPRLLQKGWHHVSVDTFEHKMDKTGLAVSRRFQNFLVRDLGFAPKAHLIGMSWGGFFSVRYTAYNPGCVEKIYLDAPFLNFDGRWGRPNNLAVPNIGPWAKQDRKLGEWTDDPEMPINLVDKLVAQNIPILLLYGGQDQTLTPINNSELFVSRYKKAGGDIKVTCRPLYGHHPHGVEVDEDTIIDFFGTPPAPVAVPEKKVGIIGLDTSHAIAFTRIMNVAKDPEVAGFRVVAAYQWGSKDILSATNRYPKNISQMKEMGVEIVDSIADLLTKVDCVCLETNDGREHFTQAEEVFKSGKPVFIDKPLAHNLTDALKIYKAGKKYNAKYFSSSALRYGKVAQAARRGDYGKIRGAALTSPSPVEEQGTHNFYTWYGIHGFEPLVTIMGTGIDKVSCFRNDTDDVINAVWKDGRMGELRLMRNGWVYTGYVMPETPKDRTKPIITFDGYPGYEPLVREIARFFRTGDVPVTNEETLEVMAFMEAAEMSAKRGGTPVTIAEAIAACGGM